MSVLCLLLIITKYRGTINAVLRKDLGILLIINYRFSPCIITVTHFY